MSFINYKNIPLEALTCWPVDVFDRPGCPDAGWVGSPKYNQVRGALLSPSDEASMNAPTCACSAAKLCPALCNPEDYSPPGSSVHRISRARILEWVAISFPTEGLKPGLLHWQVDSLLLSHQGSGDSEAEFNVQKPEGNVCS